MGRKMAGSMFATLMRSLPRPSMFTAMPMRMVPPTALISSTTSWLRAGPTRPARRVSPPWNTRMNRAEQGTPKPIAAAKAMEDTKSRALLA